MKPVHTNCNYEKHHFFLQAVHLIPQEMASYFIIGKGESAGVKMFLVTDLKKTWHLIAYPKQTFDNEKIISGYWPLLRWFLLFNVIPAIFNSPCMLV